MQSEREDAELYIHVCMGNGGGGGVILCRQGLVRSHEIYYGYQRYM